ncbi:MAG: glycosyltransferase family 4 protein [Bacteroidota bacterium]
MRRIILDCERMKYPHTGLYHFCYQLGMALQKKNNPEAFDLSYYIRKKDFGIFGNKANYISQYSFHKFLPLFTKSFDIWHAAHQGTQYMPHRKGIKILLTIHDLNFLHEDRKTDDKKKKEIKKLQNKIDRADHIVAISNFVLNDIKNNFLLKDTPTTVVYNGCNIAEPIHALRPANAPNEKFIYTIGTITDKKNFHVLPSLLVGNNFHLIISGITHNKNYYNKIIEEAKYHGVERRLSFTHAVTESEKRWYLQNCEVFVFPSIAEGFGLPVLEAMYFGKPIILSTHTSLPEIGGEDAFYFNSFDPEEMRKVLNQCLAEFDDNRSQRLKERCQKFDWNQSASKYFTIYQNI